jgi:hypothetical protein
MDEVGMLRQQLEAAQDENRRLKMRFVAESKLLTDQLQQLRLDMAAVVQANAGCRKMERGADERRSSTSDASVQCMLIAQDCSHSTPTKTTLAKTAMRPIADGQIGADGGSHWTPSSPLSPGAAPVSVVAMSKEADRLMGVITKLRGERQLREGAVSSPEKIAAVTALPLPSLLSPR